VTERGDIDADTALQLWQYLSYLVSQGHHHIVLDLRGMVLIDSAGVQVLARVSAWTRRKGGELVLRSASPALAEQLELARPGRGPPVPSFRRRPLTGPWERRPDREGHVADDRVCPRAVLAADAGVLDHPAEEGLRMIKAIRSYLDTWEGFLQDRQELSTICVPPTRSALLHRGRSGQPRPTALGSPRQRPSEIPDAHPVQA
jgi:anti-anti-sigma factor